MSNFFDIYTNMKKAAPNSVFDMYSSRGATMGKVVFSVSQSDRLPNKTWVGESQI